jgi:hypothetical protein
MAKKKSKKITNSMLKHLVAVDMKGLDAEHYGDYDEHEGYCGADQIILEEEGVIITLKHLEKDVRKLVDGAKKFFGDEEDDD